MSWVMECFFMYFDILMWIMVLLLLNKKFVSVLVSLVFFILVGLRNMNDLIGWLGFWSLVWVWCMVVDIVWMVLDCFIIWFVRIFFICNSFFCLFFSILLIGILVYFDIIWVIWDGVMVLFIIVFLFLDVLVLDSFCFRFGIML